MKKNSTKKAKISEDLSEALSLDFAKHILSSTDDAIICTNVKGEITFWNKGAVDTFGYSTEEVLGKSCALIYSKEDQLSTNSKLERVLQGESFFDEETVYLDKAQNKIVALCTINGVKDAQGTIYQVVAIAKNITKEKNVETTLEETLFQNQLAVDVSKLAVWQVNVVSGEVFWNDRHLDFYGITRKEFTNDMEGWRKQLHPDDKNYAETHFESVFKGELIQDVNFRIIRPNGEVRYLVGSATPIIVDGKVVKIFGVNQDVTYQKNTEVNLKDTLSRLNLAVDTANLGVWMLDFKTGKLDWNDKLFEIYGIAPSDFDHTKHAFEKMVHPDDLEFVMSGQEKLSEGKSISDLRFRIIRPNTNEVRYIVGTVSPVFIDGQMAQLIGINNDVTEEKLAQEELDEAISRLNLAINTSDLGVWSLEVTSGKLLWDDAMLETFGVTPSEFDGTLSFFLKHVHPEDLEFAKEKINSVLGKKALLDIEFRIIRPNNEVRYIDSSATSVYTEGKLERIIGVTRDVTDQKISENRLKDTLLQLTNLKQQIEAENIYLKEELELEGSFNEIVGSGKSLRKILKQVEQVAKTDSTVLILGETGTGKELIARAIHNASDRKAKPMVKVNCSALSKELIESEFFGHEMGAFTSAVKRKIGRFELANGGTIFLDEIGDLPVDLQTRLLRVLQESEFERVGGEKTIKVDVRVIAATNKNLEKEITEGNFRQDLYYRLNVFPITCPPLRDRINDIPLLVNHFVNKYNIKLHKKIESIDQKSIDRLIKYSWPGNIRELEHVIERAIIVNQGDKLQLGNWFMDNTIDHIIAGELTTLEILERDYITKVLETTNWRIRGNNGASEILGLKPTTLESRMKKMDIRR